VLSPDVSFRVVLVLLLLVLLFELLSPPVAPLLVLRRWWRVWVVVVDVSVSFDPLAELPEAPRSPLEPVGSLDVSLPGPGWLPVSPVSLPLLPMPVPDDWANAAPPASAPESRTAIIVILVIFIGALPFASLI